MNKLIACIFIILTFTACNMQQSSSSKEEIKTIRLTDITNSKMNFSEIFENQYYISLETEENALIGRIDKLIIKDSLIYILDRTIGKSMFIFNLNGKLIKKIHSIGDGPGEFKEPADFCLNPDAKLIHLYCSQHRKAINYTLLGDYVNEWNIGLHFSTWEYLGDDTYSLFLNNKYNVFKDEALPFNLLIMTSNNKLLRKEFQNESQINMGKMSFSFYRDFNKSGNKILFLPALHDTIYVVNPESTRPAYILDFGRKTIPFEEKEDVVPLVEKINSGVYNCMAGPVMSNGNWLFFCYSDKGKPVYAYYSIVDQSLLTIASIENDVDDGIFNLPVSIWNDNLIVPVYPEELYLNKKQNESVKLAGLSKPPDEFSNPLLMVLKIKSLNESDL